AEDGIRDFHVTGVQTCALPIYPIQNARYYVLDARMRPLPPGIAGDLYIGGTCLAAGYLNREELTRERFLPDPFRPGERIYKTGRSEERRVGQGRRASREQSHYT